MIYKGFWIKKVSLSGEGEENPATVEFNNGLNIISGPSNTGKSWIVDAINYALGANNTAIDVKEYEYVELVIDNDKDQMTIIRPLFVSKSSSFIEWDKKGIYGCFPYRVDDKTDRISFTDILFDFIGISKMHYIPKNEDYAKQRLTFRTFSHLFVTDQTYLQTKKPILLAESFGATASKSAILCMLKGDEYTSKEPLEPKQVRQHKQKGVAEYISSQINDYNSYIAKNKEYYHADSDEGLLNTIEKLENTIKDREIQLSEMQAKSTECSEAISAKKEELIAGEVLHDKYVVLAEQYDSDLKRLAFIIEGQTEYKMIKKQKKCPLCGTDIVEKDIDYIQAAQQEIYNVLALKNDLGFATDDLLESNRMLESEIEKLSALKKDVDVEIEKNLLSELNTLRSELKKYTEQIEKRKEYQMVNNLLLQSSIDFEEYSKPVKDNEDKYRPNNDILEYANAIEECMHSILSQCEFDGLKRLTFDVNKWDVKINGSEKKSFGQGYRTYINTAMLLTVRKLLADDTDSYYPGFLVLDSPLVTLKESKEKEVSDTMKVGLFEYLWLNQKEGQVIVIENELPNINLRNINHIEFTGNETGRYGFIPWKRNSDVQEENVELIED